jgi:hypothetical protein
LAYNGFTDFNFSRLAGGKLMPPGSSHLKFVDDELAFTKWFDLGTIRKARKWFENNGIVNPYRNTPPTEMTLWVAANRYVVNNPEVAREYYKKLVLEFDPEDDDQWYAYLVSVARKPIIHSEERLIEWLNENDLWDYYDGHLEPETTFIEDVP